MRAPRHELTPPHARRGRGWLEGWAAQASRSDTLAPRSPTAASASSTLSHVVALDGSHAAIAHLRRVAQAESLPITAAEADLRTHEVREDFDAVAGIGLLMFFDCTTASAQLQQ